MLSQPSSLYLNPVQIGQMHSRTEHSLVQSHMLSCAVFTAIIRLGSSAIMSLWHLDSMYDSASSLLLQYRMRCSHPRARSLPSGRIKFLLMYFSLCLLMYFNLLAIRTVKPFVDPKQRIRVHICDGNRRGCFGRSRIGIDALKLPAFSP
jgi:hypothetical protein